MYQTGGVLCGKGAPRQVGIRRQVTAGVRLQRMTMETVHGSDAEVFRCPHCNVPTQHTLVNKSKWMTHFTVMVDGKPRDLPAVQNWHLIYRCTQCLGESAAGSSSIQLFINIPLALPLHILASQRQSGIRQLKHPNVYLLARSMLVESCYAGRFMHFVWKSRQSGKIFMDN